jgi:hypothetical protein
MKLLRTLYADLRERQIFPAVVMLAVLAVGIPIFASIALSKVTPPATVPVPLPSVQLPKGVRPPQQELADLNTTPAVTSVKRHGAEPDAFRELTAPSSGTTAASSGSSKTITGTKPTSTTPTKTTPARTTPVTTTPAKTTPVTTTPAKTTPTAPKSSTKPNTGSTGATMTGPTAQATPTTGPATLKATQAYAVNIDTKDATGTHVLSDVVRLAPLPAAQSPEVIFLGVLQGGKKAAFLFTNSVKVSSGGSGAGLTCLPDANDCQIVELSPGQGMNLAPTSNTALIATFTFELMSISANNFSSSAAATQARQAVSTAGQTLLPLSNSSALATLRFDSKVGALVHQSPTSAGSTGSSGATGSTGSTGSSGATGTTGVAGNSLTPRPAFVLSPLR